MENQNLKKLVKEHWEKEPCESRAGKDLKERRRFFQAIDRYRYEKSPFIYRFADFKSGRGKRVLEIGPGSGSDFINWAKNGALLFGRDLTEASVKLCLERLEMENLEVDIKIGDVENLDFPDIFFDIVYSYGVIHHTPDTKKAVEEIYRILKPGGTAKIMIYHSKGLMPKYQWILFALFRLKPWKSVKQVVSEHNESPGTKLYSKKEARELFKMFDNLKIETIVDAGDILDFQLSDRYKNNFLIRKIKHISPFLKYIRCHIPSCFGTTMLITARKPIGRKKKIKWINLTSRKDGGFFYGRQVRESLSNDFEVELKNINPRYFKKGYLKHLELFFKVIRIKEKSDLFIRYEPLSVLSLFLDRTKGKNIILFLHQDFSIFSLFTRFFSFFLQKLSHFGFKKADAIVTISEYWRKYFLEKGYDNVYKIYPGFNLADFEFTKEEMEKFKKEYGLDKKPIIYIGNCQKPKGVVEAWRALRDLDVHLVTSGEQQVKIPVKNLNLEHKDYLRLLKASSLAVTMSKFKEGWCMTAHEAMLCRTPIIGSGLGGMEELLNRGRQIICKDFKKLNEEVQYLLAHPETRTEIGEDGYIFAKDFTIDKFNKAWLDLVKKIII